MTQFDLLDASPIARRTDPITSHEAADAITKDGTRASQRHTVLLMVRRRPGHTSAELAASNNADRYVLARRLPDLRDHGGLVYNGLEPRVCKVTGKRAQTWWPA